MNGDQLFNFCYNLLRIFHWGLFFVVVEIMFWCAGWMIFGLIGNCLTWTFRPSPQSDTAALFGVLPQAGKYIGLVVGVLFTRYVRARYSRTDS